jgi:hypothetical protein
MVKTKTEAPGPEPVSRTYWACSCSWQICSSMAARARQAGNVPRSIIGKICRPGHAEEKNMIGHIIFGYAKGYRKLHRKYGYCLTCNKYSECEISVLEKTLRLFFRTIRDYPEAYLFDWAECDHRVGIFKPEDIQRYKAEQVETNFFAIPDRRDMEIQYVRSPIRKFTLKHYLQLAVVIAITIVLSILLITFLEKIGFHGPIF